MADKVSGMQKTVKFSGLILFCLFVLTSVVHAQEREKLAGLSGEWKIILGDNSKFARPDLDDSEWEKLYVPSSWQREGFRNYHGYAWYRKKVEFAYNENDELFIELGRIDDVDEIYLNGHFIGRTGGFPPDYYTAWNYSRKYQLPSKYLSKNGKNVIAIRVYDEGGEGGLIGNFGTTIGIYRYKNYSANTFALFGKWKFHLTDNPEWSDPSLNDSDWEEIMVPASWESQGFSEYDGFAWYRKSFRLPEKFNTTDMMILLGKIDDLDQVFINGKMVGSTGNMNRKWTDDNEYSRHRTYTIPDGLLKPGQNNVVAVRVYDQTGVGGIYEGPVTIVPQSEYKEFWRSYRSNNSASMTFFEWLSSYLD